MSVAGASARLRLFVALRVGPAAAEVLAGEARRLAEQDPALRLVRPADMHVTLQFLGDCPEGDVAALAGALDGVAAGTPPFTVGYAGLGVFEDRHPARHLWAAVHSEPAGSLARLAGDVEQALVPLGYPRRQRPYVPHATIAKLQRGQVLADPTRRALEATPAGQGAEYGREGVSVLNLMVSLADPVGYAYKNLTSHRLGGA